MSDLNEDKVKSLIDQALKTHTDSAFFDGDVYGHKRAHRLQIDDYRAKQKRKEEILSKIITGAAWFVFLGICSAIGVAIKTWVNQ